MPPGYLRCEYMTEPLGIDNTSPQLNWRLEPDKNMKQTAFRVLVATSPDKLGKHDGDLWDSGKVASNDETGIVYAGKPLASGTPCYWKVMSWDRNGQPSQWSRPASWTMGLLRPEDWESLWIGFDRPRAVAEQGAQKRPLLPAPRYLRKEFKLAKPVKRAMLYASALGNYEMHINGNRVGKDYFTPGWTDYNKRVYYNAYDVTGMVKQGDNAIGSLLADGWYSGYIGFGNRRDHYGKNPRLRARLLVAHDNGSTTVIPTDRTWKASTGPILEGDFLMGETYDARLEMPGWDAPGFDAVFPWSSVNITSNISAVVQAYPSGTVKIFREIEPLSVTEPEPGNFVFDMGSNFAGFARLKVQAKRGTRITLHFGERLKPDGTVYTTNLRGARATDTYVCKGDGPEIWEPRFTFHGFQYVGITGHPGVPGKDAATGIELSSATPAAGKFECSNRMLNQLYRNICQTQRANFIDIPTDCPQRDERLGWTGDAQAYVRTACCNMDVQSFFRKWLVDLEDAQFANGDMPQVAPRKVAEGSGGAAWADAGVICPWSIYEIYGDKTVLERHYDAMAKFVDFRANNSPGFLAPKKFHCFGDWLNIKADTPKDLIRTAYTAGSARIMSRAAAVLGKKSDAAKYHKLYQNIKKAFKKAYVDKEGKIKGDTQTAYLLALEFDLVDGEMRKKAEQHLIERIKERHWHLSTGFVGTRDLMHVLTKIGRIDVAYRLLFTVTYPSWLFPVKNGATSIWERWDSWTPEGGFQDSGMNSFSHYAYGAVGQWMFENIGGINSASPGFRKIIIKPAITRKLTWARTSYDCIHGKITVGWKLDGNKVTLDVEIPPNATASIHVPGEDKAVEVASGKYTFESET